jgi:hypothetical protein
MVTSGLGVYATNALKKAASKACQNSGKKPRKSPARKASAQKKGAASKKQPFPGSSNHNPALVTPAFTAISLAHELRVPYRHEEAMQAVCHVKKANASCPSIKVLNFLFHSAPDLAAWMVAAQGVGHTWETREER